jgi:hypothetical protein
LEQIIYFVEFYLIPFLLNAIFVVFGALLYKRMRYEFVKIYHESVNQKIDVLLIEMTLTADNKNDF